MSLIQEALKRKMEEKSGAAPAASPPPPPLALATPPPAPADVHATPPMPSGMTVQEPSPARGNVVKIIGMVGAILVMVSLAGLLIFMAIKSWSSKGASPTQASSSDRPLSEVSVPSSVSVPPAAGAGQPVNPMASITERVSDMKGKVVEAQKEGAEITGGRPPEPEPRAAPVAAVQPPPAHVDVAPAAGTAGSAPVVESQEFSLWPRVTVNGILAKGTRGRGMAIINNQMMSVNESVEGVRLVEVKGQGVLLEFGGESRFVEIGQTVQ